MSVWTAVQDVTENYPSWPQPFECQLRGFRWWHCGEHHTVEISTVANCFGHFWWTEIFPSMQELARKQVTGTGKCGFIFKGGKKNPLSILWGDSDGLSRRSVVAGMVSPITTVFFAWWATTATMDAASMAHSMLYAEDASDQRENTILIDARTSIFGLEHIVGGILSDEALCAKILEHPGDSEFILAPSPGYWKSTAIGTVNSQSWTIDALEIYFSDEDGAHLTSLHFAGGPGYVQSFKLELLHSDPFTQLNLEAEIFQHGGTGLGPTLIALDRWVAEWEPAPFEEKPCVDGLILRSNYVPADLGE